MTSDDENMRDISEDEGYATDKIEYEEESSLDPFERKINSASFFATSPAQLSDSPPPNRYGTICGRSRSHTMRARPKFLSHSQEARVQFPLNIPKPTQINIPPAITFAPSKDQENLSQNFSNPMPKPSSPTKIMVPLRRTVSDIPHRPSPLASISRLQRSSCGNLEIHPPILPITKRDASGEFVSTSTVAELIEGKYPHLKFVIIDCRFKFEFDGGHIKNAETIIPSQLEDKLSDIFFKEPVPPTNPNLVVIFHCEFSSKRGPEACKTLRQMDRLANRPNYPKLSYPYAYIMEGGYQNFYRDFPNCCNGGYVEMKDKRFTKDLKKNKALGRTKKLRSSSAITCRPLSLSRSQQCLPFH
mmetsp:Transcript_34232/g.58593  ORF Transcript_34232/g.58593 Transcript_34232/m.58593 type:complete len:358 (+) Transcript_34232:162-1235(+)